MDAGETNIEKFYEVAEDAMKFRTTYSIVQGDFNGKVGCAIHPAKNCVEKYGGGVRNTR